MRSLKRKLFFLDLVIKLTDGKIVTDPASPQIATSIYIKIRATLNTLKDQ